jgi:arylsulfatase A-like enzyme
MAQPDILVFMSDQHSGLVNCYAGDSFVRTPNLDAIARSGTAFLNM